MRGVTLGLGGNLGDRRATLRAAAELLARAPGLRVVAWSRIYETPAMGPPQPDYLNAAVRAETELALPQVLEVLLATERALGRVRAERWGPRTIDLDLLHADGETLDTPGLVVPHPGLRDRPFALAPLLDVTPDPALAGRLAELGGAPPAVGALDEALAPEARAAVDSLLARASAG